MAKARTQPKCPSADEWILKLRYTYAVDNYSAIGKNEKCPLQDPELITLCQVTETLKHKHDMAYTWNGKKLYK